MGFLTVPTAPEIGEFLVPAGTIISRVRFGIQTFAFVSGADPSLENWAVSALGAFPLLGSLSHVAGKSGLRLMGPELQAIIDRADSIINNGVSLWSTRGQW